MRLIHRTSKYHLDIRYIRYIFYIQTNENSIIARNRIQNLNTIRNLTNRTD